MMNSNIAQQKVAYKSAILITDFYQETPQSCFCQCGKILPVGSVACMPDNNAAAPVLTIAETGKNGSKAWAALLVDPRKGKIIANYGWRWRSTPCQAVRDVATLSADGEHQIRPDTFEGDLDWPLLVAKVSDELVERGRWLAEVNPDAPVVSEHPLTVQAFVEATEAIANQPAEEIIEERTIGGTDFVLKRIHNHYIVEETILGAVFQSDPPYDSLIEARIEFEVKTGQAIAQSQDFAEFGDYDGDPIGYSESTQPYLY